MSLRGVYRILRLPLFLTAVVDIVAGYTVALLPRIERFDWTVAGLLAGTASGLYLFGMVENDVADVRRDRLLGVPRPLVTGDLGLGTAIVLMVLTAGLAAYCAARLGGGAVVLAFGAFAAINLYNLWAKHGPAYVAMPSMGFCRLLNFGVGVTAAIGVPRELDLAMFLPTGPHWVRMGVSLFFATMVVTGYSICARRGSTVSTRPWLAAMVVTAIAGFAMIGLHSLSDAMQVGGSTSHFTPPVARVVAALILPLMWPGGLWGVAGMERKPAEYGPFIERMLYWFILMDVAFVIDGMLIV